MARFSRGKEKKRKEKKKKRKKKKKLLNTKCLMFVGPCIVVLTEE